MRARAASGTKMLESVTTILLRPEGLNSPGPAPGRPNPVSTLPCSSSQL
jgi:hypothetical protein